MKILVLALFALGVWLDVLLYRWLRKRWPTFAKVVLILWLSSGLVQLYRLFNRPAS